ncbi:MAG: type IV pilus twitching motility protein PilT [Elusimicrobia bacterium]|nr:type IV pilus twitching motility protein PilT [Elusimicrobiota bacterium]
MITMDELLRLMYKRGASDLHLTVSSPPQLRIDGELIKLEFEELTPDLAQRLIYSILSDNQKEKFEKFNELDLSIGVKDVGRIRMNVFRQRGHIGAALRSIPNRICSFEELRLPPVTGDFVKLPKGLVLITGPTGSGKTTTLASIIDYINENRHSHIVTIEDPIEYVHAHKNCIVNQREVGNDTNSFTQALKYVLRQDPDVILVGEMRDLETIAAALTIAETGHLVFATLHTTDAPQSINRIIDVFPPFQQTQIRAQLSFVLQGVLCQQLIPKASGSGRVMCAEVLVVTPAIRNLIREQKTQQIPLAMQTGAKYSMQTMNYGLYELYSKHIITYAEAMVHTLDVEDLQRLCKESFK